MITVAVISLIVAALPALLFLANLRLFLPPPEVKTTESDLPSVSILIPARNESSGIHASVTAALASQGCRVEVIVLDDHSTDGTSDIVAEMAGGDSRVRCVAGVPLPSGWNGKQFACYQLARVANHDELVFLDADVRLRSDALARLVHCRRSNNIDLLSAFPHQITGTWLEKWLIPMMHYLLLGYLPLARMRATRDPSFAAGCGQLFLTTRQAYNAAGTHEAIATSRHDGIKLPRAYRKAGLATDVVDGTDLAECRMYNNAREVIRGLLKNAGEGIAQPKLIMIFTILLMGGSVLPLITLILATSSNNSAAMIISALGVVLGHLPRAIAAKRFRQPLSGVLFHSLATVVFITLQWIAMGFSITGRQIAWRGRTEAIAHAPPTT